MKKFLVMALAVASAAAVFALEQGRVAVSLLNARKAPSVKSPVMMKLKSGTKLSIIRRCDENWLEIVPPEDAPVYVDEVFVASGKASRNVKMFSGKGRSYPVWGELKKGEEVTLLDDRAFGWVRIVPPERLRLYVVALYVDGAEAVKQETKALTPDAGTETSPERKPAVKEEAKPEKKEAAPEAEQAQAEQKPAAKPAAAKPAKQDVKAAAAKPEKKPVAKPAAAKPAKQDAKAVKPAAAKPAKPAAKPAKPAAKPAKQAEVKLTPVKPDAALKELNIKATDKGRLVTRTGVLSEASGSLKAASFMLVDDNEKPIGFVYYPGKASELNKNLDRKVTVRGTEFRVPKWKTPVVVVQTLEVTR